MPTGIYKRTEENKRINSLSKIGKKKSLQHRQNISKAIKGDNHWNWQGDNASYSSKHKWIVRERGNPMVCDFCGTTERKWYDWANISQQYKRDVKDYMRLCRPCHWAYDHK